MLKSNERISELTEYVDAKMLSIDLSDNPGRWNTPRVDLSSLQLLTRGIFVGLISWIRASFFSR